MTERVPFEVPEPDRLRVMRERLGLSQAELADLLGFKPGSGKSLVRAWEQGMRGGEPCAPTPLAWRCFRIFYVASLALEMASRAGLDPDGGIEFLRVNTPEVLL